MYSRCSKSPPDTQLKMSLFCFNSYWLSTALGMKFKAKEVQSELQGCGLLSMLSYATFTLTTMQDTGQSPSAPLYPRNNVLSIWNTPVSLSLTLSSDFSSIGRPQLITLPVIHSMSWCLLSKTQLWVFMLSRSLYLPFSWDTHPALVITSLVYCLAKRKHLNIDWMNNKKKRKKILMSILSRSLNLYIAPICLDASWWSCLTPSILPFFYSLTGQMCIPKPLVPDCGYINNKLERQSPSSCS